MKKITILIILGLCLISCDWIEHEKLNSFVCSYHGVSKLELNQVENRVIKVDYSVYFAIYYHYKKQYVYNFEKLAAKHGDIGFNKKISWVGPEPGVISYQNIDFTAIRVFTENDYNSSHLAGSSVNDIVRFLGRSSYPFIKSKYKLNRKEDVKSKASDVWNKYVDLSLDPSNYGFNSEETPFSAVEKMVNQLTAEDLILIGGTSFVGPNTKYPNLGFLYLTELPNTSGIYNFRVDFVADDGKTYTENISMEIKTD